MKTYIFKELFSTEYCLEFRVNFQDNILSGTLEPRKLMPFSCKSTPICDSPLNLGTSKMSCSSSLKYVPQNVGKFIKNQGVSSKWWQGIQKSGKFPKTLVSSKIC